VRWNGVDWSLQDAGTTAWLSGVWDDGKSMFAVGERGTVVSYQGEWKTIPTATPDDLYAVTGDADGVWAVGALGTIAKYDGTMFNRTTIDGFSRTFAAATSGNGGVWLAGVGGALYRYDRGPSAVSGVPSVYLRAVAAPGQVVWAVGFDATVLRVEGKTVQAITDVPARTYEGVWAASDDDVWIVGTSGTVLRSRPVPAPDGGSISDGGGPG
jgi:hypothetical protein